MMDIGDDKELMAEFAEFKELLRRDLGHAPEPTAGPGQGFERPPTNAAINPGPSPQAPRAEEAWSAVHATDEEFYDEPEDEREGGRRALFFAAAAVVIAGLAALTWVLGPWSTVEPSEDPALATAPPLAAPEAAEPVLGSAAPQPQDAATTDEAAAKAPALEESAKAPAEPAPPAAAAAESASGADVQSETAPAAGAAMTPPNPAAAPLGASIPVPAGAAAAPQLAPLPMT
ncbi:MAG: hypothetical protein WBO09_15135, partial [Methylocystis silviterrae]